MKALFGASTEEEETNLDTLVDSCKSTKVKHQVVTVTLLSGLMKAYGPKRIVPAKFKAVMTTMLDSTHVNVRAEARKFYYALFLWVGDTACLNYVNGEVLADQKQIELLKKEFRLPESDDEECKSKISSGEKSKEALSKADIDDLLENHPKEILSHFSEDWIVTLQNQTKWEEKNSMVVEVIQAAST